MEDLLNGVASRVKLPVDLLTNAHEVREYRNDVVHKGVMTAQVPFTECRSRLCRFLSHLPKQW